ncbi:Piso0_003036 [Millerozyma farinosa CBS 7064]|uniref:Piso0_003036 protein n=1 Tax=Pichia sorbitophila (strain ATCC MYA-4447 / BCRC 22081 / CBS 7064 / NBRC 10061 / NRRL Y-12695) TaxID=559304 RepID=G8YH06_PICSO|nr:Piso0_003036 [Millerozyma farinosa CBS 7064]CCE80708.1 Piso0_003036 [Millerozyma farinosa CBS 7064]
MSMRAKIKAFFGPARQYVVAGASNNPSKFGFKILSWYINHDLSVIPVNPKENTILDQPVVSKIEDIISAMKFKQDLKGYSTSKVDGVSISFLTQPRITVRTLQEIATVEGFKDVVKGLWFQPGSYDEEVIKQAEKIGLYDRVIYEDECILVRGEEGLYSANL